MHKLIYFLALFSLCPTFFVFLSTVLSPFTICLPFLSSNYSSFCCHLSPCNLSFCYIPTFFLLYQFSFEFSFYLCFVSCLNLLFLISLSSFRLASCHSISERERARRDRFLFKQYSLLSNDNFLDSFSICNTKSTKKT